MIKTAPEKKFLDPIHVTFFVTDTLMVGLGSATFSWWLVYIFNGSFENIITLLPFCLILSLVIASRHQAINIAKEPPEKTYSATGQAVALLILASMAVLITIISHRPDADDTVYFHQALNLLDNTTSPLREIHQYHNGRALAIHPALAAILSKIFDLALLKSYYLIVPAFFAALSVLVFFRLFLSLGVPTPVFCAVAMLVIIVAWGDTHRSPGNFAYVRLFQGKAIASTIIAPMMLAYAVEIYKNRTALAGVLFAFCLTAAIGMSHTMFVIGGLFCLMVTPLIFPRTFDHLRAGPSINMLVGHVANDVARIGVVLIPFSVAALLLFIVRQKMPGTDINWASSEVIEHTVGHNIRGIIGFIAIICLPAFVQTKIRMAMACTVVIMIVLAFNPVTGNILNKVYSSATWRITWVIPFAAASAVLICNAALAARRIRIPFALTFGFILALYIISGRTTLGSENNNAIGWPNPKIEDQKFVIIRHYGRSKGQRKTQLEVISGRVCIKEDRCY